MSELGEGLLSDREVYSIVELVNDRGWGVLKKRLTIRVDAIKESLLRPTEQRRAKLPDDYLRGQAEALEWVLSWPELVAKQRLELEDEDRQVRRRRQSADLMARLGPTFPGASQGLPEV